MTPEEIRLLRTYANGPRIWDAASVFRIVTRLAELGMIVPVGEGGAYTLAVRGKAALAALKDQR